MAARKKAPKKIRRRFLTLPDMIKLADHLRQNQGNIVNQKLTCSEVAKVAAKALKLSFVPAPGVVCRCMTELGIPRNAKGPRHDGPTNIVPQLNRIEAMLAALCKRAKIRME